MERFDIHLGVATGPIEVWYYPGNATPNYNDAYANALSTVVTGQGQGSVTPLPALTTPINIPAGLTYTFYITAGVFDELNMYYSVGVQLGQVYASDVNLEIRDGYASGYPFMGYASPRRWNGKDQIMHALLHKIVVLVVVH